MKTTSALRLASAIITGAGVSILIARALAARRLRHDVEQLFAQSLDVSSRTYRAAQLAGLPAPVARYFRHVLREGQPYLRWLRMRHAGQFKADLAKPWAPITGEEYMTADPPGFIWQGTTRRFTARDEYVAGHGRLTVRLLGAVPVVRGAGRSYDQGELLRWLGESTLLPTNLLPNAQVSWHALDDRSARLDLTYWGQPATYLVRFNERDEIEQFETLRHQGTAGLVPWVGRVTRYRELHGVRVPTLLEASWVVGGRRQPYGQFIVQELAYNQPRPF